MGVVKMYKGKKTLTADNDSYYGQVQKLEKLGGSLEPSKKKTTTKAEEPEPESESKDEPEAEKEEVKVEEEKPKTEIKKTTKPKLKTGKKKK